MSEGFPLRQYNIGTVARKDRSGHHGQTFAPPFRGSETEFALFIAEFDIMASVSDRVRVPRDFRVETVFAPTRRGLTRVRFAE